MVSPKTKFLEWDTTAGANTDVGGIGILGTNAVNNFDDALRTVMAQLRSGVDGEVVYAAKTGNYTAVADDNNAWHRYTATATVSLTAAATLGANWHYYVQADGADVTIDPNSTETINGAATLLLQNGQAASIICNGTAFFAQVVGVPTGIPTSGFRNKLINPRFIVNTTATALTTLTAGQHWYDGWKGGPAGCTLSVTSGVVTITAGTLVQIVDGNDLETGTHVINWTGTATCTVDAVAKTKGQTAALTRGTNCTVSFGTGTLSFPQLEPGSVATAFEQRPLSVEEGLCQTRLELVVAVAGGYQPIAGVNFTTPLYFKKKRAVPIVTLNATIVNTNTASSVVDNIFNVGARYVLVGNGSAGVSVFAVISFFIDARL